MRKLFFSAFIFFILTGFITDSKAPYPLVKNESFGRGEVLNYKMTYGIFTIGKGKAQIYPEYYRFSNRECFKVEVIGKTVGMVDWVADIDDQFTAHVDTAALIPLQFYRRIREGRYKKDEWTNFDQIRNKIEVRVADKKTGKLKEPKFYDAPPQVRDLLSGYLLLRTLDFSKYKINDTINVKGFFEDSFYHMKILYKGKDVIRSKVGKIRTVVLVPVMPDNKMFEGENSITAWFSDDKNRIPVKISAEMFVGSAGVELTSYSGLKNPLNMVKK
jgi:hypothetical protein